MSHSSWRTPIVPIQLGAMTSAPEERGCGTALGWRGGPGRAGAAAETCASWNLPPSDLHLGRAAREDVRPFQSDTNVVNCSRPSCPAECVVIASETHF